MTTGDCCCWGDNWIGTLVGRDLASRWVVAPYIREILVCFTQKRRERAIMRISLRLRDASEIYWRKVDTYRNRNEELSIEYAAVCRANCHPTPPHHAQSNHLETCFSRGYTYARLCARFFIFFFGNTRLRNVAEIILEEW